MDDGQVVAELDGWLERWPPSPAELSLEPPAEAQDLRLAPGYDADAAPPPELPPAELADPHADLRERAAAALAARAQSPGQWWPIETRQVYHALVEWLCLNAPGAAFSARPG